MGEGFLPGKPASGRSEKALQQGRPAAAKGAAGNAGIKKEPDWVSSPVLFPFVAAMGAAVCFLLGTPEAEKQTVGWQDAEPNQGQSPTETPLGNFYGSISALGTEFCSSGKCATAMDAKLAHRFSALRTETEIIRTFMTTMITKHRGLRWSLKVDVRPFRR